MIFFSLYECCRITKGAMKSCIYDLERNIYCSIPNTLYEVIKNGKVYTKENRNYEHLKYLEKEKFIYFTDSKLRKRSLSVSTYYAPFKFEDIIIDATDLEDFELKILKVNPFDFETTQLRFFNELKTEELILILEKLTKRDFTSVEIIFNHFEDNEELNYIKAYKGYRCLSKLIVMGYKTNKVKENNILFTTQKLTSFKQCGIIDEKLFNVNIREYLVSKSFNSCLNKKVSIDINGNIKNCPSMKVSYGNIKDITLDKATGNTDFREYWEISKDAIEVCKDCEFRYICSDCRAYTERTKFNELGQDISKPLKCGYDPYKGKWEDWFSVSKKKPAIDFYNMTKYDC